MLAGLVGYGSICDPPAYAWPYSSVQQPRCTPPYTTYLARAPPIQDLVRADLADAASLKPYKGTSPVDEEASLHKWKGGVPPGASVPPQQVTAEQGCRFDAACKATVTLKDYM